MLRLAATLLVLATHMVPSACYCIGAPLAPELYSPYDIVIVDPDETSLETLRELHEMGKTVLAYINVGYAEDWRWYWPLVSGEGIVHDSAGYEGEYFVEYWRAAWRMVILNYTLRALNMGYDGVFLDNVDAASVLADEKPGWAEGVDPRVEMARLVAYVSMAVHGAGGLVYVNIGSATDMLWDPAFLAVVDGVLREEAATSLEDACDSRFNQPGDIVEALVPLLHARVWGRTVIIVEFVDSRLQVAVASLYPLLGITPILQPACDPYYTRPPLPLAPDAISSSSPTGTSR